MQLFHDIIMLLQQNQALFLQCLLRHFKLPLNIVFSLLNRLISNPLAFKFLRASVLSQKLFKEFLISVQFDARRHFKLRMGHHIIVEFEEG
jgi:hypothetical protein